MKTSNPDNPTELDSRDRFKDKTVADRYHCLDMIGTGGMGVVYLAEDTVLSRQVVLKMLLPTANVEKATSRFLREALILSRLKHPHIVTIHDFGTWEDSMFIVLEYLEGETLQFMIQQRSPLTTPWIVNVLLQMIDALEAAHQAGVIHRDLKPSNVFCIPQDDGTDYIKILDFGTAISFQQDIYKRLTSGGEIIGTPHYMSPEQIMGKKDISFSVDIYSLGVILYEMLSGTPPFSGESTMTILLGHLYRAPEPLDEKIAEDDLQRHQLATIVNTCLSKNPRDRYGSIQEIKAALTEVPRGPSRRIETISAGRSLRARQFYQGPLDVTRREKDTYATIPIHQMKLLVIEEDDLPVEQSLTPLVRLANYNVDSFVRVDKTVLKEMEPPDVVILNTGSEVDLSIIPKIRKLEEWRMVPCLICGPEGDMNAISGAIEAGAADYLSYPFDPVEVTQKINRVTGK